MVKQSWLVNAVVVVPGLLLISVVTAPVTAQQGNGEVVIQGENKQPARSSFEYEYHSDTAASGGYGSSVDHPEASKIESFENPEMRRDIQSRHGKLESKRKTVVRESGNTKLLLLIVGLGVVALAL